MTGWHQKAQPVQKQNYDTLTENPKYNADDKEHDEKSLQILYYTKIKDTVPRKNDVHKKETR